MTAEATDAVTKNAATARPSAAVPKWNSSRT
jgi:hypothetical protein